MVEITSQSKTYRKYQILIKDWKTIGLNKKSWIRIDNVDVYDEKHQRSRSKVAHLNFDTIKEMLTKIEEFNKHFWEDPWDLMSWFKSNQMKLYTLNTVRKEPLIMNYKDIKGSSALTSFNLTYLFYKCIKENKYKASLYWIKLYTVKNEALHLFFSIFEARKTEFGTIYIGPRYAGIIIKGKLDRYPNMIKGISELMIGRLKVYHKIQIKSYSIYKFTEEDIKLIKPGVSEYEILTTIKEDRGDK